MTIQDANSKQMREPVTADNGRHDVRDPARLPAGQTPPTKAQGGSHGELTDQQLMQRIVQREDAALETLFERYRQAVYAICLRVLRNESDAEEALVDIFWELWTQPARFDGGRGTLSTYLMMLARSRAIDHHRARAARGRSGNAATAMDVDDRGSDAAGPAETAWLSERRDQVQEAMQVLSPAQREVVELAFFEGLSHQQIADRLKTPLGTIKTRIRLGLIRLRDTLRTASGDEPA
ncbi:MAG: sigma-70 family RNA polymerase sigma factor [Phycisphaeraceae bacterium]